MSLDLGEWVRWILVIGIGVVTIPLKILFWYRLLSGDFGPRTLLGKARDGYREALDEG